jgi:hypothetical protein
MRKSLSLIAMVAVCACAGVNRTQQTTKAANYKAKDGTPVASNGQPAPGGTIVCDEEMPVGSHIPKKVCRYQEDVDQARYDTQDFLHAHPAENVKPGG